MYIWRKHTYYKEK